MPRYINRRANTRGGATNQPVVDMNIGLNIMPDMRKTVHNNDDLIIDEKSIYEIDSECYERARRARLNARQNEKK